MRSGIFVTQRGRPKKQIIKSDAQRAKEYRQRRKCGVHYRCEGIIGEPWRELKYPKRQQEVKIIWRGDYDQYVALPGNFCYLPPPGQERPKRWHGPDDDYEPAIIDDADRPVFDSTEVGTGMQRVPELKCEPVGEELCPDEKATVILEERGERVLDAAYRRSLPKGKNVLMLWGKASVTVAEYHNLKRWSPPPRCSRKVPTHRRAAVGATVDIVTTEPVSKDWIAAIDDVIYELDDLDERVPMSVVSEWTCRVARGHVSGAYVSRCPLSQTTKKTFQWPKEPKRKYSKRKPRPLVSNKEQGSWDPKAPRTPDCDALVARTERLIREREADGKQLTGRRPRDLPSWIEWRGGSITGAVRHISREYRASIAPCEMAMLTEPSRIVVTPNVAHRFDNFFPPPKMRSIPQERIKPLPSKPAKSGICREGVKCLCAPGDHAWHAVPPEPDEHMACALWNDTGEVAPLPLPLAA
jgi:hypothetical protein